MRNNVNEIAEGILNGNRRQLAKGITLVESKNPAHRQMAEELLSTIMPFTGKSIRIGITGVPGVGKSTFIEQLGLKAIIEDKRVAVLAIDPSSSINKGSILGDKTRMEQLSISEDAFIRPSPSGGFLGGVANTTYETMLLCEAAGYDYILIETVGVGQSEVLVNEITDVFLFLKLMGSGDELQGIKRGVMEMVDIIFINKVNDENRKKAVQTSADLKRALPYLPEKVPGWKVPVLLGSALENKGISNVYNQIHEFVDYKKSNHFFEEARKNQAIKRYEYWVQYYILEKSKKGQQAKDRYLIGEENVSEGLNSPSSEARSFVDELWKANDDS